MKSVAAGGRGSHPLHRICWMLTTQELRADSAVRPYTEDLLVVAKATLSVGDSIIETGPAYDHQIAKRQTGRNRTVWLCCLENINTLSLRGSE